MIFLLIFLLISFKSSFSGYISPSTLHSPIITTISNANEYTNYTFNFLLSTSIPPNSSLQITFPQQFSSNLGINILKSTTCSLPCTISSYTVFFTFYTGLPLGIEASVTVSNVKNPISSGGTGNFQLKTTFNAYIFDENLIFGTLGIGPQPGKLTACYLLIANQSEAFVGKITEYRLSFKTIQVIPFQSFMKLTFPLNSQFNFPNNLRCETFTINGMNLNMAISCQKTDNSIIFTGLTSDIPLDFEVGLKFYAKNPPFAGYSDTFVFQIFRINTQYIYDQRSDIPAIFIKPAPLESVLFAVLVPNTMLTLSKVVTFKLNFNTTNELTDESIIKITFPSTFALVYNSKIDYIYIKEGIFDYNSTIQATLTYDSTQISISNFKKIDAFTIISIRFNAITPSVSGVSEPIIIQTARLAIGTYRIVDQDLTKAVVTIINTPSSSTIFPNGLSLSNSFANAAFNTIKFMINPSVNVPVSGYISIRIPDDFTVLTPNIANCLIDALGTQAQACTKPLTNTILIKLTNTIGYYIGVQNTITLSNIVKNPINNGTFLFDISTFSSDGSTLLESFTDYIVLSGASLTIASGYLIGATISTPPDYFYSILIIKFTLEKDLVAETGKIEIKSYPPWDFDLGTGFNDNSTIPCEAIANIVNIVCVIRVGSLKSPTKIVVTGFETVLSGKAVEIHFPNIRNPVSAGVSNFDIYLINVVNRVNFVMNFKTISITTYASTVTKTSATNTYTTVPSPVTVSSTFSLTYTPGFVSSLTSGGYLLIQLPNYDTGFFTMTSNILCDVSVTTYSCTLYPSVQWILIKITSVPTPISIKLQNLKWPRHSYIPSQGIITRIITSVTYEDIDIRLMTNYMTNLADSYTKAEVIVDRDQYNAVGCFYSFLFKANNDIPANSDLYLTFPSMTTPIYNLLSTPQPWLIPKILPVNSKFSIVNLLQVKISLSESITKLTDFSFIIAGVKNPNYGSADTGWVIEAKLQGNKINYFSTFTVNFALHDLFSTSIITLSHLTANPTNKAIKSLYSFEFITNIPYIVYPSTEIYLIFPSKNYQNLPTNPHCTVSLGMTYYEKIEQLGASYLIKTSQIMSNTSQTMKFSIKDINNPTSTGFTDTFSIIIIYDGTIIAKTDTSVSNSIEISPDAGIIVISSFALTPINEAETTIMRISFDLSHNLDSNMIIKLIFPSVYAEKLANGDISCVGIQSINSELACSATDRILTINDIYWSSLSETIIISISNIINPNYIINSNTGYIALAVQTTNSLQYLDYTNRADFFSLLKAPAYCLIRNITISNSYSRLETDYSFNLTFFTLIPTMLALGKIVIKFPKQYDIPDNSAVTCSVISQNYGTPSCSISNNVAFIQGNLEEFSGNLVIILKNVKNPTNTGEIDQFFVYSFDGYNNKVLERSYLNIGTLSFSFILKGAPVYVNNDQALTIQTGTQSDIVEITIENPSILNLTFKPLISSGFSVIPSTITLSAGTKSTSFRVSIPETFTIGTYYILWETFNDENLLFTPLKKTTINVVNTFIIPIQMSSIYDIPYAGESLPISFSVINPPNSQFLLIITFDNPALIKANPNILTFTSGVTSLSTVFNPTSLALLTTKVTALFTISGTSKSSYSLITPSFLINFLHSDISNPTFLINIVETTRTYIVVNINSDRPVLAYYMLALAGTETPSFLEVSEAGPPASLSTESVYGKNVIHTSGSFRISGILAENNYTLFVYIQDQSYGYTGPKTINFQTLDNYRPAEFSVRVNKANLTENEKLWLKQNIAYVLALNITNFEERKYDLGLISSQTPSSSQSIVYFYLIAMPFNTIMPTPISLANALQSKAYDIALRYPSYDQSYSIRTAEFPKGNIPNIVNISNIMNSTETTITFSIRIDNYGKIFVLATPLTTISTNITTIIANSSVNTTNSSVNSAINATINTTNIVNNSLLTPTSFQIYKGLNSRNLNLDTFGESYEISGKNTNFTIIVKGLTQNTDYVLFVTVGNAHPYRPDFADSSKIVKLIGKTLKRIENVGIVAFGEKMQIFSILTIILMIFSIFF